MSNLKRRSLLIAGALAITVGASVAQAQQPIKIGHSMALTGTLGGGGKAALIGLQLWVEDVNAKGGLLGRKVELITYDDQSSPATTPGIYTKLLDVDKVDLLIAPYGTVPTAPIMPLVKQRGLLLMGNFSFQVNRVVRHDMWFNNAPWNDARSWSEGYFEAADKLGGKTIAILAADQEFAQNLARGAKQIAGAKDIKIVYEQNYPPSTVDFSSMVRAVRAAVSRDFPVILRWSQWKQQDYTIKLAPTPQALEKFLEPLVKAGVDCFHCSTRRFWEPEFEGSDLNAAGWTKKITGLPTITVGSVGLNEEFIQTYRGASAGPASLDRLIEMFQRGDFDLVAVGRALIVNPNWPTLVKAGKFDELKPFSLEALPVLH